MAQPIAITDLPVPKLQEILGQIEQVSDEGCE